MATGIAAPSVYSLDEVGVADLLAADLPLPSDDSGALVACLSVAGTVGSIADPRPEVFSKTGLLGPTHDLVWLDHIHVLPRTRNLGSVVSAHQFNVEVWNAYMRTSRTLDEITVEGPSGITVVDHLGQPAHYPASDSQVYSVEVSAEGDPQIDNVVTWVFLGVDSDGSNVSVLGFRLITFPFPPNMARPINEKFGYLTDIIRSFAGTEQRIQLREVPVGTLGYSVYLNDKRDAQMANAILFGNQARAFGVGRWQFRTPLTVAALEDALAVYCDTTDIPFIAGGLVMLWMSPYDWEVQTIESVASDHLVLTSGLRSDWGIRTAVLPALVGRLSTEESVAWESLASLSQTIIFDIDGFTP